MLKSPLKAGEVINVSGGRSHATEYKYPNLVFKGKLWNFTIDLMRKDINIFNEIAKEGKVPTLISNILYQIWSIPSAQGKGNEDCLKYTKNGVMLIFVELPLNECYRNIASHLKRKEVLSML